MKKIIRPALIFAIIGALLTTGGSARAQTADERLAAFDGAAARAATLEANPHFRRDALFGAARNLVALADRWTVIRPQLAQLIDLAVAAPSAVSTDFANGFAAGKPISKVTLGASRYSGFTQSETATAWCGTSGNRF